MDLVDSNNDDAMDVDRPSSSNTTRQHEQQPNGAQAGPSFLSATAQGKQVARRASSVPLHPLTYAVGYVYAVEMLVHFKRAEDGHPEQPLRIKQILETLMRNNLTDKMKQIPIRKVHKNEAMLVHSEDHWDKILQIQYMTPQQLVDSEEYYEQMSLYVSEGTTTAALLSCGGVIEAALAVARGEVKKSFAIVRPPGHHAEPEEHMGFCFFNNVAVAARVVQQQTNIRRILILDWCNGTQRAFNDDPSVLYISLHRYEEGIFYPCGPFGSLESCGEGPGLGYSLNVPWPCPGMGDADYLHAFQRVIMPIAMEFAPELVIISAGFDAAEGDELGQCLVTPAGYAHMTHMLSGLAGGKVVVALEGGYNLDSISNSALAVTRVLLGQAPDELPPMVASAEATETVWLVAKQQSRFWKSVDAAACEPREEVDKISFSIPEILKAHRQYYLYTTHEMMQIPLMNEALESRFSGQVMSTPDLLENNTIVLFVHEFGNLRMELESSARCDVHLHNSYLIDLSKEMVEWVTKEGYALVDMNLFPKPVEKQNVTRNRQNIDESAKDVLTYIWDNLIQLSDASRVIVLGHGPGCRAVTELLTRRAVGMMKKVKVFIQVVGLQDSPHTPGNSEDLRTWCKQNSVIMSPATHPMHLGKDKPGVLKKHSRVFPIDEPHSVQLIQRAMPVIRDYIKDKLGEANGAAAAPVP
ncbi:histone deacetylase clr3 [Ephemerocybe angulata]|uniref:histone deacetylase n=1 Tax=Ephemerocybe angulata TaxID=980116 RepID=A0A8H6IBA5_9AGAR|nr:histone deacetylase clr3 [Tulosesus angulatus]